MNHITSWGRTKPAHHQTFNHSLAKQIALKKTWRNVLLTALSLIFISQLAVAQCSSCTLIVGSGAGAGVTNLSQVAAAQNLNGGCIRIQGTFYVNNNLTWNLGKNSKIYLDPGASITINTGCAMTAGAGCLFTRCSYSGGNWAQISVSTGATLSLDSCTLHHANNAVSVQPNASFYITRNRIDSCSAGVYIIGTQNTLTHSVINNTIATNSVGIKIGGNHIRINYNFIYHSNTGIGIQLTQSSQAITINDCIINGLDRAIEAKSTSNTIAINHVNISSITGVYAENCNLGFTISRSSIRTTNEGIWLEGSQTSLAQTKGTILITNNSTVSSIYRTAIKVHNLYGNGNLQITTNTIYPPQDPPAFGYYGISVDNVPGKARVVIEQNSVTHKSYTTGPISAPGGIYLNKSKGYAAIRHNSVTVGSYGLLNFGITVAGSPNCQVAANTVDGGSPWMTKGISMEHDPDSIVVCCNSIDRATRGLNMSGAQKNCDVSGTLFNRHTNALHYDTVVAITNTSQFHRGNDWSSASATWNAYFNGSKQYAQYTFYTVDPALLSDTSKVHVTGGYAKDWFLITHATEASCGSSDSCGHKKYQTGLVDNGGGTITDLEHWAAGTLTGSAYATTHWESQKDLYETLVHYPSLISSSSDISSFYSGVHTGNIGKFYSVEDGLTHLYDPPSGISTAYYAALATISSQMDSLDALDAQIEIADGGHLPGLLSQRNGVATNAESTASTLASYNATIASGLSSKISDLQTINSSISPSAPYETYAKNIRTIYLSALYAGSWDFSSEQKSAIDVVAALCPLIGGSAVYEARALQEYYTIPTWNDCPTGDRSQASTETLRSFSVYPNPANNIARISFGGEIKTECQILLLDLTGRIVATQSAGAGSSQASLSLEKCQSGMYVVQIREDGRPVAQQKLTIIH
jgi:hypothetical protein